MRALPDRKNSPNNEGAVPRRDGQRADIGDGGDAATTKAEEAPGADADPDPDAQTKSKIIGGGDIAAKTSASLPSYSTSLPYYSTVWALQALLAEKDLNQTTRD